MSSITRTFSLCLAVFLAWPSLSSAAKPVTVRVLSYNIHHGQGIDGKLDLERIANVINSVKPDLVALQEVDQNTPRTKQVDQTAVLAKLTKLKSVFGPNIDLAGGKYGNAVLSKYPITHSKNHPLPNHNDGEQRGVLEVEVAIPDSTETLLLLATHFDHRPNERERIASAKMVNDLMEKRRSKLAILAGDLNDVGGSPTLKLLDTQWARANEKELPTIPVTKPTRQIDFVLTRPASRWKVIEVKVLDEAVASDHRAILAVFELSPASK